MSGDDRSYAGVCNRSALVWTSGLLVAGCASAWVLASVVYFAVGAAAYAAIGAVVYRKRQMLGSYCFQSGPMPPVPCPRSPLPASMWCGLTYARYGYGLTYDACAALAAGAGAANWSHNPKLPGLGGGLLGGPQEEE
jgi:hypothetical protein